MTTMIRVRPLREAPTPEPLVGTLLDTANVIEGLTWGEGTGLYTSWNSNDDSLALTELDICTVGSVEVTTPDVIDGFRFAVRERFGCRTVGLDIGGLVPTMKGVFERVESRLVEKSLAAVRFTGADGGTAATDITPTGGALSPTQALALLEGEAAKSYAGEPTIHASRTIVSQLFGIGGARMDGKLIRSGINTKLVAGAGYQDAPGPTGAAPAAGEGWMYATGEVTLQRGDVLVQDPQVDRSTNDVSATVQRIYIADVDSLLLAVRVKLYG